MIHLIESKKEHYYSVCSLKDTLATNVKFTYDIDKVDCKNCQKTNYYKNYLSNVHSEMRMNLHKITLEEGGAL